MKKLLIFTLACGVALTAISWTGKMFNNIIGVVQSNAEPVLMQTKSFGISEVKNVNASTTLGSITVTGDATGEASVEMYAQANNNQHLSKDEIQQIINRDYNIEISVENGKLTAKAIFKNKHVGNNQKTVSVSFKIHTAKNVSTDLNSVTGSIHLAALQGNERFEVSTGSLHLDNISGDINGHTSTGSIHADNCNGNIKLETSTGSVHASYIKGMLDARTSTGSLHLENITAKVYATTSTGSISAKFDTFKNDATLSTSIGSVNVEVPKDIAANLDLEGSHINANRLYNFSGDTGKRNIKGKINGGGANLAASTNMGSVSLNFK
ncbi:hypothetical protein A9P82_11655 [Arachidicoccus ginsenosidimutans]|uniref:DUF4097 family beta strand repeat-containing protein n=1 Tax=Arachidicoccus sp. BS20 TaxID=1850526 RepID=UPI0007F15F82|nr:DUF4097 family beta strand repeat-containing protein [Arachidicoccus sp. BS20]ANI89884.1 hypothetical protein A9P82_11655 [Arachidicoccus sp. BS20]